MRNLLFIILIMLAGCTQTAEENHEEGNYDESAPTYSFVENHKPVWAEATARIMALADAMPEEMYGYKPHDSVRTFAEQLVHIGGSSPAIANLYLKDIPGEQPKMDITTMSRDEIKEIVKKGLDQTWEIMSTMSDQQLDEEIKSYVGNTMTRREGLMSVHDHLTNHKAKVNLYIRISGNQPPIYGYY